jgi:hypothetical protein
MVAYRVILPFFLRFFGVVVTGQFFKGAININSFVAELKTGKFGTYM